jgi:hypothetical protein
LWLARPTRGERVDVHPLFDAEAEGDSLRTSGGKMFFEAEQSKGNSIL